jgi:hypothetical protein
LFGPKPLKASNAVLPPWLFSRWAAGQSIWARGAVPFFKLFASAEGADIGDAINGEDPVEMIDFMLKELGEVSLGTGADCL